MDKQLKKCPLGIQTFSEVREGDYIYIDKTDMAYRMTQSFAKFRQCGKNWKFHSFQVFLCV
ncbi:MAG: AAA family ATPase [Bacteroidales bacterium]